MLRLEQNSDKSGHHTLSEDIGELRSHWDVHNVNFPNGDFVTDKMEINLNMLRALMLNKVRC
jgi:hypothetical protein